MSLEEASRCKGWRPVAWNRRAFLSGPRGARRIPTREPPSTAKAVEGPARPIPGRPTPSAFEDANLEQNYRKGHQGNNIEKLFSTCPLRRLKDEVEKTDFRNRLSVAMLRKDRRHRKLARKSAIKEGLNADFCPARNSQQGPRRTR